MRRLHFLLVSMLIGLLVPLSRAALPLDAEAIKKAIVFIYAAGPTGDVDKEKPLGTGFLITVHSKVSNLFALMLITARHIRHLRTFAAKYFLVFCRFFRTKSGIDLSRAISTCLLHREPARPA
jgi:hypothetical protein